MSAFGYRIRWYGLIWFLVIANSQVRADHDLDIYVVNDMFVHDLLVEQGRIVNFVPLQDSLDLFVVSHVETDSHFPLSSFGHHETTLLISFHNRLEVYDLSQPAAPVLGQVLELRDQQGKPLRWPDIAKLESRYFVVAGGHVFALHPPSNGTKWAIKRVENPPTIKKEDLMKSRFPIYRWGLNEPWPFHLKTTELFRWEVGWKLEEGPDYRMRVKFLWKILRKDDSVVSSLRLGEVYEAFGE